VVLLDGDLGAGKTTFVKHLLKQLGVVTPVTSPTYTITHTYQTPTHSIIHADLYRIKNINELDGLGLEYSEKTLLLIEWGGRFEAYFAPIIAKIILNKLPTKDDHARMYTLELFNTF
jgi:tRNA threonylcarbamoyladenosine biosynthesis protein TsaE